MPIFIAYYHAPKGSIGYKKKSRTSVLPFRKRLEEYIQKSLVQKYLTQLFLNKLHFCPFLVDFHLSGTFFHPSITSGSGGYGPMAIWPNMVKYGQMVSNCQIVRCQIVCGVKLSANVGGVKLSRVSNCPQCQIVPGPFLTPFLRPWFIYYPGDPPPGLAKDHTFSQFF